MKTIKGSIGSLYAREREECWWFVYLKSVNKSSNPLIRIRPKHIFCPGKGSWIILF